MTLADYRPALREYLLADASIAALVGTRIYALQAPEGETQTLIVYQRISGLGYYHMTAPSGLVRGRLQIDCWSKDQTTSNALADLVKERIDGYSGTISYGSASPQASATVQGLFFADRESDEFDEASKLHGVSRDFFVFFEERQ